jgi:hypothetical protein
MKRREQTQQTQWRHWQFLAAVLQLQCYFLRWSHQLRRFVHLCQQ